VANQDQEDLKGLRREGNGFARTKQSFLYGINAKRAELV
jgi:hypothetical protein